MLDGFCRTIDYIRISVTDRCNLRCRYCMPPEGITCLPMHEILSYEETIHLCRIFAELGVRKVKITGGEPFVRRNVCHLIRAIKDIPGIDSVTITTNGILALQHLKELKAIGIDGINFSLDTLDPEIFRQITGTDALSDVLKAIDAAAAIGIPNIKINCVPVQGSNTEDIPGIAAFAKNYPFHVRFIELMPIGLGKDYQSVPESDIRRILETAYGSLLPAEGTFGNGPAHYSHIDGFKGHIGFISAMSHMFCEQCNRIRLTADGQLKTCLFYEKGVNLKPLLRSHHSDEEIMHQISLALHDKPKHHDLDSLSPEHRGMSQIGG